MRLRVASGAEARGRPPEIDFFGEIDRERLGHPAVGSPLARATPNVTAPDWMGAGPLHGHASRNTRGCALVSRYPRYPNVDSKVIAEELSTPSVLVLRIRMMSSRSVSVATCEAPHNSNDHPLERSHIKFCPSCPTPWPSSVASSLKYHGSSSSTAAISQHAASLGNHRPHGRAAPDFGVVPDRQHGRQLVRLAQNMYVKFLLGSPPPHPIHRCA